MAIKTQENNEKILSQETKNKVPFSVIESYKNLRMHLLSVLEKSSGKVVAISSANASEGKSTTAINLAITLSQLNKKVILIDADSRRATIHQKLKLQNEKGCLDIINGDIELKDGITAYNEYLDIITAGSVFTNPTELYCSSAFERMITELRNMYDYVVFDTPPVNLVSDALAISQKCDGLVFVVRTGATTYENFRNAILSTKQLGINVLGAVMNGVGAENNKYLKYGFYGAYKRYRKSK